MRSLKTTGKLTRGRDLLLSMWAAQRGHQRKSCKRCQTWTWSATLSVLNESIHSWDLVVVGVASPSGAVYMGADAPKRWGIPPGWHYARTHLIWWWSYRSTVVVLLPTLGRKKPMF